MFGIYPGSRRAKKKFVQYQLKQKQQIDLDEKKYIYFFPLCLLVLLTSVAACISSSKNGHWFDADYMMLTGFVIFWPAYSFCRGIPFFLIGMAVQMVLLVFGSHLNIPDALCFFLYVLLPFVAASKEAWMGFKKLCENEIEGR